jgi:hypothetical protein
VFQTKEPWKVEPYLEMMPPHRLIGTTIESDHIDMILPRGAAMSRLRNEKERIFVTIEPIMRFSPARFASLLTAIAPAFVNIGADSKRSGLPEPTAAEVLKLIADLEAAGIEVRRKPNLGRILGAAPQRWKVEK